MISTEEYRCEQHHTRMIPRCLSQRELFDAEVWIRNCTSPRKGHVWAVNFNLKVLKCFFFSSSRFFLSSALSFEINRHDFARESSGLGLQWHKDTVALVWLTHDLFFFLFIKPFISSPGEVYSASEVHTPQPSCRHCSSPCSGLLWWWCRDAVSSERRRLALIIVRTESLPVFMSKYT